MWGAEKAHSTLRYSSGTRLWRAALKPCLPRRRRYTPARGCSGRRQSRPLPGSVYSVEGLLRHKSASVHILTKCSGGLRSSSILSHKMHALSARARVAPANVHVHAHHAYMHIPRAERGPRRVSVGLRARVLSSRGQREQRGAPSCSQPPRGRTRPMSHKQATTSSRSSRGEGAAPSPSQPPRAYTVICP